MLIIQYHHLSTIEFESLFLIFAPNKSFGLTDALKIFLINSVSVHAGLPHLTLPLTHEAWFISVY